MWQNAKNQYHLGQALLANLIYMFPSRKLKIIGVTGTDGKTTTASMIYHILTNSGYKVSLITTVGAVIDNVSLDLGYHVTTPGRFTLQSYLKKSRKFGAEFVIIELTSHALDQYRAFGVPIEIGVLTNVSNEHLDYHKTYEKYVLAKLKLLKQSKIAIINKDDRSYQKIKNHKLGIRNKKIITYGMGKDSDINPNKFPFKINILGKFNEYNALAAIAACKELGVNKDLIRNAIANFKTPKGRQEIIYKQNFTIINDFAHTPNAFLNVIPETKKITKGRLIHVFGAAGARDSYKRPEMGKISSEYSDIIILTAEDPRNEKIEVINQQIISGISNSDFGIINYEMFNKNKTEIKKENKYIILIPDRREAIRFAVTVAKSGDVVLLTGKGHEKSINYGNGEEPWDEGKVALDAVGYKI